MIPANVTVQLNSGHAYLGRAAPPSSLPTWRPSPGTFANISQNTLLSAKPSGWPNSDTSAPFINWSSAVFAADYGPMGAWLTYGSGHLNPGSPHWSGVWAFPLHTLVWEGTNLPAAPFVDGGASNGGTAVNSFNESIDAINLGTPYTPHTYDGLAYQPAANGGGSKGSLLQFFIPGDPVTPNLVRRFDLSSRTAPPTRIIDQIMFGSSGVGAYPMSAVDTARGGVWVTRNNGNGPLKFVSFADSSVTSYPNTDYNVYGDNSMVYIPAPYDCLVGMGPGAVATNFTVYVSRIVNNIPQPWVLVTMSGAAPDGGVNENGEFHGRKCGGQWSTILNAVISYQGAGITTVYKMMPPAPGSLTTGVWTWTTETLTGVGGAIPSKSTVTNPNNGLPYASNGSWGRFIEIPALRTFVYCGSVTGPVQAWTLQGM